MNQDAEINIFKSLDYIRDHAKAYAKAKANRIYLDEFRKTKKAICMKAAEIAGAKAVGTQERDAYADPEYGQLLEALQMIASCEVRVKGDVIDIARKVLAKTLGEQA